MFRAHGKFFPLLTISPSRGFKDSGGLGSCEASARDLLRGLVREVGFTFHSRVGWFVRYACPRVCCVAVSGAGARSTGAGSILVLSFAEGSDSSLAGPKPPARAAGGTR